MAHYRKITVPNLKVGKKTEDVEFEYTVGYDAAHIRNKRRRMNWSVPRESIGTLKKYYAGDKWDPVLTEQEWQEYYPDEVRSTYVVTPANIAKFIQSQFSKKSK